jgi:hypothetical protein
VKRKLDHVGKLDHFFCFFFFLFLGFRVNEIHEWSCCITEKYVCCRRISFFAYTCRIILGMVTSSFQLCCCLLCQFADVLPGFVTAAAEMSKQIVMNHDDAPQLTCLIQFSHVQTQKQNTCSSCSCISQTQSIQGWISSSETLERISRTDHSRIDVLLRDPQRNFLSVSIQG